MNITQVNQHMTNVEMTVIQEAGNLVTTGIANHSAAGHGADAPCCEDCDQAKFRVPPEEECQKVGCAGSCAYQNTTCDAAGEPKEGCLFPFTYLGETHTQCVSKSDHGETKRAWCFLDT